MLGSLRAARMSSDGQQNIEAIQEKLLVLRAQAREMAAFRQLVEKYERRLLYYIHRILGNETDRADVLQEVWMKVFLKIGTLRAPEAFRVWLYKITHDIAVSHLRKTSRHQAVTADEETLDGEANIQNWNELELFDRAEEVHAALEQLSLPHREVLTLRFLEELEISEIANVVDCQSGTVKSRLYYAKAAMRQILEANSHE